MMWRCLLGLLTLNALLACEGGREVAVPTARAVESQPRQAATLLGDLEANGGRNYAAVHCAGKSDATALPIDPRELIAGDNLRNPDYAVWYNDPFEICENDTLFETQARQNALLGFETDDPDRVYTAKPRPATCGEWRTAVEDGRRYIMQNAITGGVLTRESIYNLMRFAGMDLGGDPEHLTAELGAMAQQRYGWPPHVYDNPFPLPDEDPSQTEGGSLQLPIALTQIRDDDGRWTGRVGATCFACHIGQIGTGEVLGNSAARDGHPELYGGTPEGTFVSLNGSNTDTGLALFDVEMANGFFGADSFQAVLNTPPYMANRTRGSNAADQEIVNVLVGRDFDTLDRRNPVLRADLLGKLIPTVPATGGDQDMPTWWWTHNKTRYLWVGFGSAGSARGNFFPSSTNNEEGHWNKRREGDYQDLDMWLNAIEAPPWPQGYCSGRDGRPASGDKPHCINRRLAEQGAVLFHAKNLWASDENADIPRPPGGNGSCAGCHGAYSPHYSQQPGYLPDPRLAGMSGYTVPLSIIGTDPAQADFYSLGGSWRNDAEPSRIDMSTSWFAYPDANPDYVLPEDKTDLEERSDEFTRDKAQGSCALRVLGGYTAQPLHGVWATAPYFHNGSVTSVWEVLQPADRPAVWLRQQVPVDEAGPYYGDRGFDTNMQRAFDYDRLGWKYQALSCDARPDLATAVSCYPNENGFSFADLLFEPARIAADYLSPPYVGMPGQGEVDNRSIYNTHAYSKGNQGHEFTKVLSDAERWALIEYLKTL